MHLVWILFVLGVHQNLSKLCAFINQSPPFYENPVSSVRPSETKTSRCLCVHPHSGGVVGFSIIGFSSMTPPRDGGDGGDGDCGEVETKSPLGPRPSPAPAPRNKIIPFGGPSLRPGMGVRENRERLYKENTAQPHDPLPTQSK